MARCVEGAVIEDDVAIADGVGDTPVQQVAIERTPTALALNEGGCHTIRFHGADNSNVGLVARTQETSISYAEQLGWLVAHQVDDAFERDYAFVDKAEHLVRNSGKAKIVFGNVHVRDLTDAPVADEPAAADAPVADEPTAVDAPVADEPAEGAPISSATAAVR